MEITLFDRVSDCNHDESEADDAWEVEIPTFDWEKLRKVTRIAVRFLEDCHVVSVDCCQSRDRAFFFIYFHHLKFPTANHLFLLSLILD